MRKTEWTKLTAMLGRLTEGERRKLGAELAALDTRASSIRVIEDQAPTRPDCPRCASRQVIKNGHADGLQRFKCRACEKTFNVLTGTPLVHLHQRGKWIEQARALRDGLVLHEAAKRMNIAVSTAHRWRHRFLAVPKAMQAHALSGVTEADETFFLRSAKGQRQGLGRKPRRRGGKATKRGTSGEQVPVLVARDRSGNTADFILPVIDKATVTAALRPKLADDAILCTDGSGTLTAVARDLGVEHHAINASAGMRVNGPWHIQNVNSYHGRLKGWLRRFRGVATKYLESYLGWFRTIEQVADSSRQPAQILAMAVSG